MEQRYYDYVVVGCGALGSAALYWLSKRAEKGVLGIEQFQLGHERGGSTDHSRIISLAYPELKYTRLTPASYEAWKQVEDESGHQLVHKTGTVDLFWLGTKSEEYLTASTEAMAKANIPVERLSSRQLRQRFPQFRPDDNMVALYEPNGGLVDASVAVSVNLQLARAHGATIEEHCTVIRIDTHPDDTATVHTTKGSFRCRRVIVASGAWTNNVLGSLGVHIPIKVTQEQVTYFATPHLSKFSKTAFPVFRACREDSSIIYGFPTHVNSGTKIGQDGTGAHVTAETRSYVPNQSLTDTAVSWLQKYIPEFLGPEMYTKTCLYAMTMDRDFVLDSLEKHGKPQVLVCVGSGHVFKFSSLFGKILSELAIDGKTKYPIDAFTMDRPAVSDPNYEPVARTGRFNQSDGVSKL